MLRAVDPTRLVSLERRTGVLDVVLREDRVTGSEIVAVKMSSNWRRINSRLLPDNGASLVLEWTSESTQRPTDTCKQPRAELTDDLVAKFS